MNKIKAKYYRSRRSHALRQLRELRRLARIEQPNGAEERPLVRGFKVTHATGLDQTPMEIKQYPVDTDYLSGENLIKFRYYQSLNFALIPILGGESIQVISSYPIRAQKEESYEGQHNVLFALEYCPQYKDSKVVNSQEFTKLRKEIEEFRSSNPLEFWHTKKRRAKKIRSLENKVEKLWRQK